jgi:glutamate N-acetyltransferase/amino-acid N-acetyltransferase
LAAVGYSGARIDPNKIDLAINGTNLAHGGCAAEYDDDLAEEALKKKDIFIVVDLGLGNAEATAWTCDFSYDYVKVNAGYRT